MRSGEHGVARDPPAPPGSGHVSLAGSRLVIPVIASAETSTYGKLSTTLEIANVSNAEAGYTVRFLGAGGTALAMPIVRLPPFSRSGLESGWGLAGGNRWGPDSTGLAPGPKPGCLAAVMRFFNTTGPIDREDHYFVPPLSRLDLDGVLDLIRQKRYFVLHAPRQSGKTTVMGALLEELNASGQYRCVYVNVEIAQAARQDVGAAMRAILSTLAREAAWTIDDRTVERIWPGILDRDGPHAALSAVLSEWSRADPKPLVLFVDEIDALVGDTLISALRQLRSGYRDRPGRFPQSVVLCGVRDVRDYRIHSASGEIVLGGSAFNVKAESLRLGDFSKYEVRNLLGQHVEETGQVITDGAVAEFWAQTCGQPWLVNALAYEACFRHKAARDRTRPITLEQVRDARERLILRRDTHLDQLVDKLREPRVRRVVEPLLSGGKADLRDDDVAYVRDIGLLAQRPPLAIANPIYREVIPRELTSDVQETIADDPSWYVSEGGRLLVTKLLQAFQEYFRENSEHWVERFGYKEAGPQLLLQAFLQRIVNSGGRVEREYGLGRMRTDLLVIWPGPGGRAQHIRRQKVVIECKVLRGSLQATLAEGLPQTQAYMDRAGTDEGHLVIFDRTPDRTWEERIFFRNEQQGGKRISVWGV